MRVLLALICTIILYIIFAIGSMTPVDIKSARQMVENFRELVAGVDSAFDIFLNNFAISLLMLIPVLGPIIGAWIVYNTGLIISSFASIEGINVILFLILPILTIYGILEFIGYGTMMSEGILLIYAISKKGLRHELKILPIIIVISAGVLGLAAAIEFSLLTITQSFI